MLPNSKAMMTFPIYKYVTLSSEHRTISVISVLEAGNKQCNDNLYIYNNSYGEKSPLKIIILGNFSV